MATKGFDVKTLILTLAVLSPLAMAADDYCKVDANTPIQRFQLDVKPSWFISADPAGRYVGVIGDGNHIYDLQSGGDGQPDSIRVPGSYDPVFTPDGRYLTVPPGEFYRADNYRRALAAGQPSASSPRLGTGQGAEAAYQSVGVVQDGAQQSRYLYISDAQNGNARADLGFFVADVNHQNGQFNQVKSGSLCPNIDEAHTPMISPDGQYLSILNPRTRSTQIYRLPAYNQLDGGNCQMVSDLGVPTGKVSFDFSANPRRLAFHVDQSNTNVGWFASIDEGRTKDTYVMELGVTAPGTASERWSINEVQRLGLHTEAGTGTYYPRWRRDGTLVAMSIETGASGNPEYYLDVFNPEFGKSVAGNAINLRDPAVGCDANARANFASLAIAYLWQQMCDESELPMRGRDYLRITPWLNRDSCLELVNERWDALKGQFANSQLVRDTLTANGNGAYGPSSQNQGAIDDVYCQQVLGMTRAQLAGYCPAAHSPGGRAETVVSSANTQEQTPQQVFNAQCGGCHSDQDPKGGLAFMRMADGSANTMPYNPANGTTV